MLLENNRQLPKNKHFFAIGINKQHVTDICSAHVEHAGVVLVHATGEYADGVIVRKEIALG